MQPIIMSAVSDTRKAFYAARLKFERGLFAATLARDFNLSYSSVRGMLQTAKDQNLYKVTYNKPEIVELEDKLKDKFKKYGLKDVFIAETDNRDYMLSRKRIAQAADWYINRLLKKVSIISVAGGGTIFEWVNLFKASNAPKKEKKIEVCPTHLDLAISSSGEDPLYEPSFIATTLLSRLNEAGYQAKVHQFGITGPLEDNARKNLLRRSQDLLKLMAKSDLVLVGIGYLNKKENSTQKKLLKKYGLSTKGINSLIDKGVIGDIATIAFDEKGDVIETAVSESIVSISADMLISMSKTPRKYVIGMAGGKHKVKSILRVIEKGYINILITDQFSAKKLLSSP